jgi:hypothetical protein
VLRNYYQQKKSAKHWHANFVRGSGFDYGKSASRSNQKEKTFASS